MTMTGRKGIKGTVVKYFAKRESDKMIDRIIRWFEYQEKTTDKIAIVGAPYILSIVMQKLEKQGRDFDFGERGGVATGGDVKAYEGDRVPVAEFRKQVEKVLALREYCLDIYGMVRGTAGWCIVLRGITCIRRIRITRVLCSMRIKTNRVWRMGTVCVP